MSRIKPKPKIKTIPWEPAANLKTTTIVVDELDQTAETAPPCGLAAKLALPTYELPESEIAGHWMKIAIVVEQRRTVFDAPGSDQEVDCLADCDPAPT